MEEARAVGEIVCSSWNFARQFLSLVAPTAVQGAQICRTVEMNLREAPGEAHLPPALLVPCMAIAALFAYVSNEKSGTVSVVDTATGTVVTGMKPGAKPRACLRAGDCRAMRLAPIPAQGRPETLVSCFTAMGVASQIGKAALEGGSAIAYPLEMLKQGEKSGRRRPFVCKQ